MLIIYYSNSLWLIADTDINFLLFFSEQNTECFLSNSFSSSWLLVNMYNITKADFHTSNKCTAVLILNVNLHFANFMNAI